jgi:hypothetical protein
VQSTAACSCRSRLAAWGAGLADMAARLDSDDLAVDAESVLVLRNAGPVGAPGMPEAGYIPIPRKLARAGVKVRRPVRTGARTLAWRGLRGGGPSLARSRAGRGALSPLPLSRWRAGHAAATGGNLGLVHAAKGDDAVIMAVSLSFDSLSAIPRDETSKEVRWW